MYGPAMDAEACLPEELRRAAPTITPVSVGLSGAGVFRVDAAGQGYVLKIAAEGEPGAWRRTRRILEVAAGAGVAPRVVHVDEARRAILSERVVDRAFPALFANPQTRPRAIELLGATIRRVHALPLPDDAPRLDARALLGTLASSLAGAAVPAFAAEAVARVRAEPPPAPEHAPVLSHNDVNPTNLVFDGGRLVLVDWDMAGVNDPLHDLATVALFLRMDDATCLQLLGAYDGAPPRELPAGFGYRRRLIAATCGAMFLHLAHAAGHAGDATATYDSTLALGDVHARMRAGELDVATADGKWRFGIALIKESGR